MIGMPEGASMAERQEIAGTLGYLLLQVVKAHHDRTRALLAPFGLYAGQEILLMVLAEEEDPSQTALAGKLCIQPATLTKSLDRMEKAGLSYRQPDLQDRRMMRVHLTERGRALCPAIRAVWEQLEAETFGSLTAEEQMLFRCLLEKVNGNLDRNHEEETE
jgi:DNA-binding MarR family transcriptional regulator